MEEQEFQNPILELIDYAKLGIATAEEERKAVFSLANEAIQFRDYKRAEQILRDDLYEVEFNDHQRSFRIYKDFKRLADTSLIMKKCIGSFSDYLEGILEKKEALLNFDQRIFPLILRIRKLAEEEVE